MGIKDNKGVGRAWWKRESGRNPLTAVKGEQEHGHQGQQRRSPNDLPGTVERRLNTKLKIHRQLTGGSDSTSTRKDSPPRSDMAISWSIDISNSVSVFRKKRVVSKKKVTKNFEEIVI